MLSEKGFSLIEVLVSLSILSISVIAITNFFVQADEISAGNNRKLVATNLARMTLDRIQQNYDSYGIKVPKSALTYNLSACHNLTQDECQNLYTTIINDTEYEVEIEVKESLPKELNSSLSPLKVTIRYNQKGIEKHTFVEGYVTYAE